MDRKTAIRTFGVGYSHRLQDFSPEVEDIDISISQYLLELTSPRYERILELLRRRTNLTIEEYLGGPFPNDNEVNQKDAIREGIKVVEKDIETLKQRVKDLIEDSIVFPLWVQPRLQNRIETMFETMDHFAKNASYRLVLLPDQIEVSEFLPLGTQIWSVYALYRDEPIRVTKHRVTELEPRRERTENTDRAKYHVETRIEDGRTINSDLTTHVLGTTMFLSRTEALAYANDLANRKSAIVEKS